MAIQSIEVAIDRPQANGKRKLFYKIVDSFSGESMAFRGMVPQEFDSTSDMVSYSTKWNIRKKQNEIDNAIERVKRGDSALSIIQGETRNTNIELIKGFLKEAYASLDPYYILNIEDLINNIKLNYTNEQLSVALGVELDKVNAIMNKIEKILLSKSNLNDANVSGEL